MLEQLLNIIRQDGTLQPSVLAARMNLSPAMIEAMLDNLKRSGVLNEVNVNCGDHCGGCSLAGSCSSHGEQGRLWQIKEKVR